MQIRKIPISCSTWLILIVLPFITAQTVSLNSDSALLQQRDCVQYCMEGSGAGFGHEDIVQAVGCGQSRVDSCFCRADLRPQASSYLSSCLYTDVHSCSDPTDYSAAISIYNAYCTFTAPETVTATPTSASDNTAANGVVTVTVTTSTSSQVKPPSLGELLHIAGWVILLFLGVIALPRR